MFLDVFWIIIIVAFGYFVIRSKWKRRNQRDHSPHHNKTNQQKEREKLIAIEKERSRRGGPPMI